MEPSNPTTPAAPAEPQGQGSPSSVPPPADSPPQPTVTALQEQLQAFQAAADKRAAKHDEQLAKMTDMLKQAEEAYRTVKTQLDSRASSDRPSRVIAHLKLAPLAHIDGKSPTQLRDWFDQSATALHTGGIDADSPQGVMFLASHFRGPLAKWWATRLRHDPGRTNHAGYNNVEELRKAALAVHSERDPAETARDKLRGMSQVTSVLKLVHAIEEQHLYLPSRDEDDKIHDLVAALKPHIREKVVLERPKTFAAAASIAQEVDNAHFYANRGRRSSGPSPMEVGALDTPGSSTRFKRLTEQERADLRAKGGCFYCRQLGHQVADCPNRPARPNDK